MSLALLYEKKIAQGILKTSEGGLQNSGSNLGGEK